MRDNNFDRALTQLLQAWVPPAASGDAVARIIASAQPHSLASPVPHLRIWQRKSVLGSAMVAAMVFGMAFYPHGSPLPKNDPVLQQSALSAFSIGSPNADAEELR